jgi:hypothetical protein
MAIWLKADGAMVDVKPKEGMFTIDELHDYVRGDDPDDQGYFEIVRPNLDGWERLYLVVNEDGRRYGYPPNRDATVIYAHPGIPAGPLPPNVMILGTREDFETIVGNALLCDDTEID